jgi:hypothetical protein
VKNHIVAPALGLRGLKVELGATATYAKITLNFG